MKTYIKPAIEELTIGVIHPIVATVEIPGGDYQGDGTQGAPGRKGSSDDDWEDEEDSGFGW